MAIADITIWLNSKEKDFKKGVELFEQHSDNAVLLSFFKSSKSNIWLDKLQKELMLLNNSANSTVIKLHQQHEKKLEKKSVYSDNKKRINPDQMPKQLKHLYNSTYLPSVRMQSRLHSELELVDKHTRKKHCFRIMELQQIIKRCLLCFEDYEKYGYIENSSNLEDYKKLILSEFNIRTYISKYKKRPDKQAKYLHELESLKAKIQQIEININYQLSLKN